jgi:hypothetical protein
LDGKKLDANPFQGELPRDLRGAHVFRATAPGYYTVERSLNLARDFNLSIAMRAIPAVGRPQKRVEEPAAPPSRVEPKEIEPGADLQRREPPRSGRHIDEKDPYGR